MWKCGSILAVFALAGAASADEGADVFEKSVRPLLAEHCQKCHSGDAPKSGLRLTSRSDLLKGGKRGPAAIAGNPEASHLIHAVRYTDSRLKMPPDGKLSDSEIELLARWVKSGIPWPAESSSASAASGSKFQITPEQRQFWSFQPPRSVAPPEVRDNSWPRIDLDRFILSKLETQGLSHAPQAEKRALIRRATFDLTGLPPTPEEVNAFLDDSSPKAFERVVDRLLASAAFGERWGRHWLDLVRYTDSFDSRGIGGAGDCADAWRYRDWVVKAFNSDLPYDRFLKMQIAGDLLPDASIDGVVATGMLAIGNWGVGDADKEKLLTDIADDQLDVVCKTFMALTVSCARCHDHKFDPISQKDYYALAGIFFSTHILPNVGPKTAGPDMLRIPLDTTVQRAEREKQARRAKQLEASLQRETESRYRAFAARMRPRMADYLLAAWDYSHDSKFKGQPLDRFAQERTLEPLLLNRWLNSLSGGEDRLFTTKIRDLGGKPGVHGWRGDVDNPSMVVNTTDHEVSISTFHLPPKSISVHPGPKSGVVIGWRSPINGTVSVRGSVIDADPTCGDGVAWAVDLHSLVGRVEIAHGDIPNGGRQNLGDNLNSVSVNIGDMLEFVVLPKGDYTCDTTTLDLTISTVDGNQVWSPAQDWAVDVHASNPHADRNGHAGVWSAADMGSREHGKDARIPELALWMSIPTTSSAADRTRVAREIQKRFTRTDAVNPFHLGSPSEERLLDPAAQTALNKLRAELDDARKRSAMPTMFADGAQEGGVPDSPQAGVHDVKIHIRGRYDRLGELVPRGFPEILAGPHHDTITSGSGRRQLADWLAQPTHPLTARVMVNRIWQHLFGEGIVRTPGNFGKLGERPTHQELLDWLAREFVRQNWSTKSLIRTIMLSATYQQSSIPPAESLKRDPDNRLFGRMNRRRLEAEALRDALLTVSGRLDPTAGGPAVADFAVPRRAIYMITIRSDRSGFGPLFDAADPTAPIEKRTVSTVAPQALFMMNHPFVIESARRLAERVKAANGKQRVERLYEIVYGRPPTDDESAIGIELVKHLPAETAWQSYCQLLLCANEFTYVD
jgi:mono/diheme cytochrome c family protein